MFFVVLNMENGVKIKEEKEAIWERKLFCLLVFCYASFAIFAANFEVGGGITYGGISNEFVYDDGHEVSKLSIPIPAFGINVNGTYWFNQKMGVEVDFDFIRGTVYKYSDKCESSSSSVKDVSQLLGPAGYFLSIIF